MPRLRIRDEVSEAHEEVHDDEGDELVECLNVVLKWRVQRPAHLQVNDDGCRDGTLAGQLTPDEVLPEDESKTENDALRKETDRHEEVAPGADLLFLARSDEN